MLFIIINIILFIKYFFQDVAFKLILNESEAIVRREAVKLIIEMFIHRNWQ